MNQNERVEIEDHVSELENLCAQTPAAGDQWEASMLIIITKMMLEFRSTQQNEVAAEIIGEGFQDALDDIPVWAAAAAVRRWRRSDCGESELGRPYDYRWLPAPGDFRKIALKEKWCVSNRASILRRLLEAQPLFEPTQEHRATMHAKLSKLVLELRRNSEF